MTAAASARLLVHRLYRCRTMEDVRRVGDRMGVSRQLPFAFYRREFRRRYLWHLALANTGPYVATGRGLTKN